MKKSPRPTDVNQKAKLIADLATGEQKEPETGKNAAAVELGQKGGAARAKNLSPKKRSAIAKKAAEARWGKKN